MLTAQKNVTIHFHPFNIRSQRPSDLRNKAKTFEFGNKTNEFIVYDIVSSIWIIFSNNGGKQSDFVRRPLLCELDLMLEKANVVFFLPEIVDLGSMRIINDPAFLPSINEIKEKSSKRQEIVLKRRCKRTANFVEKIIQYESEFIWTFLYCSSIFQERS